ncbi:uncharacterized protein LOC119583541 [Penaeus monodon]|uniref:uncharacterized protein LOC119583541 n=1 Tax=Penaeus monodon TaxID=6687 RepID=UPI0018A7D607|nr:uncharacterized protein LOC119583541 [Penaeus monodon]
MVVLQPIKPGTPRFSGLALKRGRARRALSLLGSNDAKANLQLAESLMTISAEEFAAKWNFDPVRSVPLPRGRFQWAPVAPLSPCAAAHGTAEGVAPASPAEAPREDLRTCLAVPTSDLARPQQAGGREARVSAGGKGAAADSSVDHECSPRTCGCGAEVAAKGGARGEEAQQEALEARRRPSADADSGIESDESIHLSSPSPPSPSSSLKQDSQPRLRQTCITEFVRPKKRLTFSSKDQQAAHTTQSKKRSASSLQDHLQPPHKKVLLQLRA